ncbi:MAG: RICIN domain-containing protein [Oscillospiraceae bacterium]|nr:RICIN domain-containing protein [Oscillospiraceae bacterium]
MKTYCKKAISLLIAFSLLISITAVFGTNSVSAAQTLVSGKEYYIRIVYEGSSHKPISPFYLEPGSSIGGSPTRYTMTQRLFKGAGSQKWYIYANNDGTGTYRIVSSFNGACLSVLPDTVDDGNPIETYPWNSWGCQRWYINAQSDGSYRFVNYKTGKTFSNTGSYDGVDGSNLVQWKNNLYHKFVLEEVAKGDSRLYFLCGFTDGNTTVTRNACAALGGSSTTAYTSVTNSTTVINSMKSNFLTFFDSHGEYTHLTLNPSSPTIWHTNTGLQMLNKYDLTKNELIVYFACRCGQQPADPNQINMVDSAWRSGAKTVVGWSTGIKIADQIWVEPFFTNLSQKKTVKEALNAARVAHEAIYNDTGLGNYCWAGGDINYQKLLW